MLFSGIDLHKRSLVIHTLDADGVTAREAELKSDRAAVSAYFGTLTGPHRAVVECVQSWYWLRDLLAPAGVDLRLAHAKYVKAIRYATVKTDRVDARLLARLLRAGLVPEAHMIGAEHRDTRDLLRSRLQLVTRAVRCQHAVGSLLEKHNVRSAAELPELARLRAALQEEQRALIRHTLGVSRPCARNGCCRHPTCSASCGCPGSGGSGRTRPCSRSTTSSGSRPCGTSTPTAGWSPAPTTRPGRRGTSARATGTATSSSCSTRRRSGPRSTTRRSGRSTGGWRGGRGRSWRGR